MKRITIYADFDFLSATQEIGVLGYEHIRGKDHFVFEYSRQWLKQYGGILLSGDLQKIELWECSASSGTRMPARKDGWDVLLCG